MSKKICRQNQGNKQGKPSCNLKSRLVNMYQIQYAMVVSDISIKNFIVFRV